MRRNPSRCGLADSKNLELVTYCAGDLVADKYRLVRQAGEGGMGEVWVADNLNLETPVAIKLIRASAQRGGAAERLLCEARAAAQLRHPAIVKVFDFGLTDRRVPYIVMELLDGESLRVMLAREGAMSPERALQIMLPIADALAAAHDRGIIHRDLKPENIFLATDDSGRMQPKVVDFGVAKVLRGQGDAEDSPSAVGTPEYMSPEQATGLHEVDARTDQWAFCVVLYELLVDAFLFSGQTPDDVIDALVQDEAPSLASLIGLDEALWKIIERGLAKDRDQRWTSMRALGGELAQWLLERGVVEDASGSSLRKAWRSSGVNFELTPTRRHGYYVSSTLPPPKSSGHVVRRCNTGETMNQEIDSAVPREQSRLAQRRSRIAGLSAAAGLAAVIALAGIARSSASGEEPSAPPAQAARMAEIHSLTASPSPSPVQLSETKSAALPETNPAFAAKAPRAEATGVIPVAPDATSARKAGPLGVSNQPLRSRPAKRVRPEDVDLGF